MMLNGGKIKQVPKQSINQLLSCHKLRDKPVWFSL